MVEYTPYAKRMIELMAQAKDIHRHERQATIQSVLLVGELDHWRAPMMVGGGIKEFAKRIGLSEDQYLKRAQAARVVRRYPEALQMLEAGEVEPSHLAMIAGRITAANAELLLDGVRNKTRREVELFAKRVTKDGKLLDEEVTIDLRLTLTESQLAVLDRARDVLSAGGKVPSLPEVVVRALEDLLERRDPYLRAQRADARAKAKASGRGESAAAGQPYEGECMVAATFSEAPAPEGEGEVAAPGHGLAPTLQLGEVAGPDQESLNSTSRESPPLPTGEEVAAAGQRLQPPSGRRPAIPAMIKHEIWLRDQGQCTFRYADGRRCEETAMLELDHFPVPWCRGGGHRVSNVVLRCRYHNQALAERMLGTKSMDRWKGRGAV